MRAARVNSEQPWPNRMTTFGWRQRPTNNQSYLIRYLALFSCVWARLWLYNLSVNVIDETETGISHLPTRSIAPPPPQIQAGRWPQYLLCTNKCACVQAGSSAMEISNFGVYKEGPTERSFNFSNSLVVRASNLQMCGTFYELLVRPVEQSAGVLLIWHECGPNRPVTSDTYTHFYLMQYCVADSSPTTDHTTNWYTTATQKPPAYRSAQWDSSSPLPPSSLLSRFLSDHSFPLPLSSSSSLSLSVNSKKNAIKTRHPINTDTEAPVETQIQITPTRITKLEQHFCLITTLPQPAHINCDFAFCTLPNCSSSQTSQQQTNTKHHHKIVF